MGLGTWNRLGRWRVLGLVHHLDGDPMTADRDDLIKILKFDDDEIKVNITEINVRTDVHWTRVLPELEEYIAEREESAGARAWEECCRAFAWAMAEEPNNAPVSWLAYVHENNPYEGVE